MATPGILLVSLEPTAKPEIQIQVPFTEHKLISTQFNLMLNSAYRLRVSPIYWDNEAGLARIANFTKFKAQYWIMLVLICTIELILVLRLLENGIEHGFHVKNMYFMFQALTTSSAAFSILLHFHTAIRKHELVALINGLMSFWKSFTGRYRENEDEDSHSLQKKLEKEARFVARMMQFLHHGLLISCLCAIPLYIMKCDFHLLHPVIPVCPTLDPSGNPYKWWYKHPVLFLSMLFLQFMWCWIQAVSIFILGTIVGTSVVFSRATWRQLTGNQNNGNYRKSRCHLDWIRMYRYLQILSQYMNNCFSHDVWPSLIFTNAGLCALLLSTAIRYEIIILQIGSGICFVIMLVILCGFIDYGSKHYTTSQDFIQRKSIYARRKYVKKIYYSCLHCTSFKVKVGPFFCLRFTIAIVLSAVFENTCTVLILAKGK